MSTINNQLIGYTQVENNEIDFNYPVQKVSISSDTSFKAINFVNGNKVTLLVKNIDLVDHSVLFLQAGINPIDAAKTVKANTYTLYNLTAGADGFFVCVCSEESSGPFPSGENGDLIILNGETVTLAAGGVYDYNTIDIQTGGKLIISDASNEGNLTELYGAYVTIDGEIQGRTLLNTSSFTKNITTKIGLDVSYSYSAISSGNGGRGGGSGGYGGSGGTNASGAGGGGRGYSVSPYGTYYQNGGNGGSNGGSGGGGFNSSGGTGNLTTVANATSYNGASGGSGGGGGANGSSYYRCGGGGSGAKHVSGKSGVPLLLYSPRDIEGAGVIDLSGVTGRRGGNGYGGWRANTSNGAGGGGGGGGTCGGSGGHLFVLAPSFNVAYNVANGSGGAGGSGGASGGYGAGGSGGAGANGINGSYQEL